MLYCSNAVARKKGRQVGEIQCKGANRSGAPVQRCKGETRRGPVEKRKRGQEIQCKGANVQRWKGGEAGVG